MNGKIVGTCLIFSLILLSKILPYGGLSSGQLDSDSEKDSRRGHFD